MAKLWITSLEVRWTRMRFFTGMATWFCAAMRSSLPFSSSGSSPSGLSVSSTRSMLTLPNLPSGPG